MPVNFDRIVQDIVEQLPKAAFGALVPLAQYLWKRLSRRGADPLPSNLVQELESLAALSQSAKMLGDETKGAELEAYVQRRRLDILSTLPLGSRRPMAGEQATSGRSTWQQWLLLYVPGHPLAWFLHILFFLLFSLVAVGCLAVVAAWSGGDPDVGDMAIGFAFIAFVALLVRMLARFVDKKKFEAHPKRTRLRKWFLLYKPSGAWAILVHLLFYLDVVLVFFGLIGVLVIASEGDADTPYAIAGIAFYAVVGLILQFVATYLDREEPTPVVIQSNQVLDPPPPV